MSCDYCKKDFNNVSGIYTLEGSRQCWRCQLEVLHNERLKKFDPIESRFEILDL